MTPRSSHPRTRALALRRGATWLIGISAALTAMAGAAVVVVNHQLNASVPKPLSFSDAPALPADGQAAPASSAAGAGAAVTAPRAARVAGATRSSVVTGPQPTAAAGTAPPASGTARTPAGPAQPRAGSPVEGLWQLASSSVAGYRIGYTSPVGDGTRVGRTHAVTGQMQVSGSTVESAKVSVDFRTVVCDAGSTCTQHVQQIMDVADYPYETFVLTSPIRLGSVPPDGKQVSTTVTGRLTLRGVTRSVTFTLTARRNSSRIDVLGSIPVNRDDYKIPDANEPGFHIAKSGTIELLLTYARP